MSSRGLAILGMHRSGTSMLAGTLRASGVYFGEVLDQKFARNPTGLQEAPAILFMQEDLLQKNGGAWHSPPEALTWERLHLAVRDLFIESRREHALWGFKDPRTLITLDGWFEACPDMLCMGIFRHPSEVAMSIHRRNEFELDRCFEIWRAYNERLLRLTEERTCPLMEFVAEGDHMLAAIERCMSVLGLQLSDEARTVFDTGHRHYERPDIAVPENCQQLYDALLERAE